MIMCFLSYRLLLNMNLGGHPKLHTVSMALGSLLDDNLFHEVVISRRMRDVILSVDRVRIRDRIQGDFENLNLDRDLYIGGVPNVEEGLVVYDNFTGCIENMYLNHSNVIAGFKDRLRYDDRFYNYEAFGGVTRGCTLDYFTVPVTFKNEQSFVRLTGYEGWKIVFLLYTFVVVVTLCRCCYFVLLLLLLLCVVVVAAAVAIIIK